MKNNIIIWIIMCMILLISCGTGGTTNKTNTAHDFTLSTIEGNSITLSALKGNVILVDFWATWCPPCQRSIPLLVDLYNKYHEKGFTVLGISASDSEDVLKAFVNEKNIPYPILLGTNEVAKSYGVTGIPHMVIIDKKGNIAKIQVGYSEQVEGLFGRIIDSLLTE